MTPSLKIETRTPLDDPREWLRSPQIDAPVSKDELAQIQKEIDSIIGVTRDNKSIAVLAWNGDRTYWKRHYTNWTKDGKPLGNLYVRPQLLYKTIPGNPPKDVFVPRFLILTRLEPEQFHPTWKRDSRVFCKERNVFIQIQPETPPKEYFLWFQTIARHNGVCCQTAEEGGANCYGLYLHPRAVLDDLRAIRKGLEFKGVKQSDPFASPDELMRKLREHSTNNYIEQAVDSFTKQKMKVVEDAPFALAPTELLAGGYSLANIRRVVKDNAKRSIEAFEKQQEGK